MAGPPNNLMPYVSQVAIGRRPFVSVYGADYDTPDGTGLRETIIFVRLSLDFLFKTTIRRIKWNFGIFFNRRARLYPRR